MIADASSTLIRSNGAALVTSDELRKFEAPPSQGRWFPMAHSEVFDRVSNTLTDAGFVIRASQLSVSKNGHRFFGTLDLGSLVADGVFLAVGIRNSTDKSFPISFCGGSKVFVCENLSFYADLLISRKHTKNGLTHFSSDISNAVARLDQFKVDEARRIEVMQRTELHEERAESLIVRALDKNIINTQEISKVLSEWRQPSFKDFEARTYWGLMNAFTTVMGKGEGNNPSRYAVRTMKLSAHLLPDNSLAVAV